MGGKKYFWEKSDNGSIVFVGKSFFLDVFSPIFGGGNAFFSLIFLTFPIAFVGKTVFRTGKKIASGAPVRGCGWNCDFLFFGKFLCKIPYSAQEWEAPINFFARPKTRFAHKHYWQG